jgi:uncharacterized protein (TIGR03546 family)
MFGLEILAKLVKILRSSASPNQIAVGFIMGMVIGLTPFWTLHNFILIFFIIILNVNIATAILGWIVFSGIGYVLDPIFHQLGFFILVDLTFLNDLWTTLYNVPVIALSKYNNTVVMGSLAVSLVLCLPVYFMVKSGVIYYRDNIDSKMQKWKIVKVVRGSKIYSLYEKIRKLGD